jgi:hypothetical protein
MKRRQRYANLAKPEEVGVLNEELDELTRRVDVLSSRKEQVIENVTILSGGTAVRHKLGVRPRRLSVVLKGDAKWWEYKGRTQDSVYLKTDVASVDAEVEVSR